MMDSASSRHSHHTAGGGARGPWRPGPPRYPSRPGHVHTEKSETTAEKEEYDKRGKKEGDRLRKGSKPLRLFEEWLEHERKKNDAGAETKVARAAGNALAGTPVPK
jgi:hypothetical protein